MGSAPFARVAAHAEKRQQVVRLQPVEMGFAPFARVAAHAEKWQQIGATPTLPFWIKDGSSYLGRASSAVEFGGSIRYRRTTIASPPPRWTGGSAMGLRRKNQRRKRGRLAWWSWVS
jgi:hypothetical protein